MADATWHREVIGVAVEEALSELVALPVLQGFYLAGGTSSR